MKVLLDQGTPVPLRRFLHPHVVDTAGEQGWATLQNGELLKKAELNRYEAFITTDCNLKYQQNLSHSAVGILVLTTTSWPKISKKTNQIREALDHLGRGEYVEIQI